VLKPALKAHPTSYTMGTRSTIPRNKVSMAWCWPQTSI